MKQDYIDRLITEALATEAEDAKEAGALGYMARAMVQATMPHRDSKEVHHQRRNGEYRLTMVATDPNIGLPFGSIPRLMLAWIGAEVMRTNERTLVLGESMSAFMNELGLAPTGGRWGSIGRLKSQSQRLFSCVITCSNVSDDHFDNGPDPFRIGRASMWWNPAIPAQMGLFESKLELSEAFYQEIRRHPVPVDMRHLRILKRSPLALDIYCWTIYRIYTLNRARRPSVKIPWESLQLQFGSGYPMTPQGTRNFRRSFKKELTKVQALFYRAAKIEATKEGLILRKSPQLIASRSQ